MNIINPTIPKTKTGKSEEPEQEPIAAEEQEETQMVACEEQEEIKTGIDLMNPQLRKVEGRIEEEEVKQETQTPSGELNLTTVEYLNFDVLINDNTTETYTLSKDGKAKNIKDYSSFCFWKSWYKTDTETVLNLFIKISHDNNTYEKYTETITFKDLKDITSTSLNVYFDNKTNSNEIGNIKNIYLYNKDESSIIPNSHFSNFTIDNKNEASELNIYSSKFSDTNVDIKAEMKTLNITADSTYKTILNINNTVEQLNLNGGKIEIKQHTRNNFNSKFPTELKGIEESKGENFIHNLYVDKNTTLTVNEEGENIPILSVGANHNISYLDPDNSDKIKDCVFNFKGQFGNTKRVILFIGCTSYQADYRLMFDALTLTETKKFKSLSSTKGTEEYYAKHITRLNKISVNIDNELLNCNLYIGCHLLREKNFNINGSVFTQDYTDLTIKDIDINIKHVDTLISGLMTSYLIYKPNEDKNYNIKQPYATDSLNQPNTLKIENINIINSEANTFRVGGVYYNQDVNRNEEYKTLTYGDINISNCKNQKGEMSLFSAIHRFPDVKNLSFAKNYKTNFDNIVIENCQFNEDLMVLHGFKNTNRDKSKINQGNIKYYNTYSLYPDNKIYFPFYYDNLGFTKFEYIIDKQDTEICQNIYLKGPKDFKDFSMYFELMTGNYKFYLGNNYDHEDEMNVFSLSGITLKVPNYKALVKDKQTNPKIDYDIGNLTNEQLIKLKKDIKDKSKFIIIFDKNIKVDVVNILKILAILLLLSLNDKAFADILFLIIFKYYKQIKNLYYFLPEHNYRFIEIIIKYMISKNYLM